MNIERIVIEFLTPCFAHGATKGKAELRPTEIRAMLRWWYRLLVRNKHKEDEIFGNVGKKSARASSFSVRVVENQLINDKDLTKIISISGTSSTTYLLGFFCGRTNRLTPGGAILPGSRATIELIFKKPPSTELKKAIRCFFSIGALGFRATRAAGAISSDEYKLSNESWKNLEHTLEQSGFKIQLLPDKFTQWTDVIKKSGDLLKNTFRGRRNGLGISAGRNGTTPNALGSSSPRQASVLHFRPVRIDNELRLALIEVPHLILGEPSKKAHGNKGSILELAKSRRLI